MEQRLQDKIFMYSDYLKKKYGRKVFRVGLSIGYTCPHREMNGGCIFCNPSTFTGEYQEQQLSISEQLDQAIPRIKETCGDVALLAYFQDETTTAAPLNVLKLKFDEALSHPEVVGLVISTRPDYVNEKIASFLADYHVPITVEFGMQSIHDKSLQLLNRGHNHSTTDKAIDICGKAGLEVGVHLIIGIPGESKENILETISYINKNPYVTQVKFHNLVVYRNTRLEKMCESDQYKIISIDDYIDLLLELIPHLRSDIVVSRLFTSNVRKSQIAFNIEGNKTKWMNKLRMKLYERNISQGCCI